MKFNSIFKVLSLAICFYAVISCQKDEISSSSPALNVQQPNSISVVNGRLKFSSKDYFNSVIAELRKNPSIENLKKWEEQFSGFTSQRKRFLSISKEEKSQISNSKSTKGFEDFLTLESNVDGLEAVRQVTNDVMATVCNQEGIVLIGNDAIKYEKEKTINFVNFNESSLRKFRTGIADNTISVTTKNNRNAKVASLPDYDALHYYFESGLRFKVYYDYDDWFSPNYSDYWEYVEMGVKYQDRIGGIWWARDASSINVSVSGFGGLGNSGSYTNCVIVGGYYDPNHWTANCFNKENNYNFTVTGTVSADGYYGSHSVNR